jgi:hypothetical protein
MVDVQDAHVIDTIVEKNYKFNHSDGNVPSLGFGLVNDPTAI